ncbi:MAG: L-serine ammonia-lyase, iron-sulfur-dependent, subunit alpha [Rikenellaceae bacterium]
MESLKKLYMVGNGPSSSHTMGPKTAAKMFGEKNIGASRFEVTLYGSLAATGRGHLTDKAILSQLEAIAPTEIVWRPTIFLPFHPNAMLYKAFDSENREIDRWQIYSVGGGSLANEDGSCDPEEKHIYPLTNITDILKYCEKSGRTYWEYVFEYEDSDIVDYLDYIWDVMCKSVIDGLQNDGVLPGGLNVKRKASDYFVRSQSYAENLRYRGNVYAYALAVSEQNASGGEIVTAPTCGSSGVVPAVLYHIMNTRNFSKMRVIKSLATAGIFGNVVKTNASVSGAAVGCQGEVGVACAASQLFGGSPAQIEYAAEMGLEHHLGLTCDPVCGLVQIPCIERNAFAAARAIDSNIYATFSDGKHSVSFDRVVEVMDKTGKDLPSLYRETAEGGLALGHTENL